jgi:DNA repair protein REV1
VCVCVCVSLQSPPCLDADREAKRQRTDGPFPSPPNPACMVPPRFPQAEGCRRDGETVSRPGVVSGRLAMQAVAGCAGVDGRVAGEAEGGQNAGRGGGQVRGGQGRSPQPRSSPVGAPFPQDDLSMAMAVRVAARARSQSDVLKMGPRSSREDPNFMETFYK